MKYIRLLLTILSIMLLVTATGLKAFALNTGFSTESLPTEDSETFFKNISITLLEKEPKNLPIDCFDVNEDGIIAIGTGSFETKYVCVYSDEGDFLYGYSLKTYGSIGVEWDGDNLNIYFVRGSIIITLDKNGNALDIAKAKDTSENNSYVRNNINSPKRTIGDSKYIIRNDMGVLNLFATSYSQLVVTTSNGEETILYDVNSSQLFKTLAICILVLAVCGLVVVCFIRLIKQLKAQNQVMNNNNKMR